MAFPHSHNSSGPGSLPTAHILLLCTLLALTSPAVPAQRQFTESEVAVALLYNVTKFVRWPEQTFSSDTAPLKLCAFPSAEYEAPMQALKKRSVGSHPIQLVELDAGSQELGRDCHVVFFTGSGSAAYGAQLRGLAEQSVLTIGNFTGFLDQGGMLALSKTRNRVNIRINAEISEQAGISYSSQLLELAKVIDGNTKRRKP